MRSWDAKRDAWAHGRASRQQAQEEVDFRGTNLAGANLSHTDLAKVNLQESSSPNVNLAKVRNLRKVKVAQKPKRLYTVRA